MQSPLDFSLYLRVQTDFVYLNNIYSQVQLNEHHIEVTDIKLYEAKIVPNSKSIYIYDDNNIIHSKKASICIERVHDDIPVPPQDRQWILNNISKINRIKDWDSFLESVFKATYSFNDERIVDFVNRETYEPTELWQDVVHNVLSYNATKDERLLTIYKATAPRGEIMAYQPHSIIITPIGTGKSTIYRLLGEKHDKTTAMALLGYVGKEERNPGLFNEQRYPLIIEQLESQNVDNIAGRLLSILEDGNIVISTAFGRMRINSSCAFVITANPFLHKGTAIQNFVALVQMLGPNSYGLGRRFGIIAYENYDAVQSNGYDEDIHKQYVMLFRAIEERASLMLKRVWNSSAVQKYCNQRVYPMNLEPIIKRCPTQEVESFLYAHYQSAYPHTRGGALQCAIFDYLPSLALYAIYEELGVIEYDFDSLITKIINRADSVYMNKLIKINLESIANILDDKDVDTIITSLGNGNS